MKLISSSPYLCLLLIPSLVVTPVAAQSSLSPSTPSDLAGGASSSAPGNTDLQLRVVEGSAMQAKINTTAAQALTVAVTNGSGAAVPDAAVALRLPDSGPTGTFTDGSHAAVAYTDATGQAHFSGLHWAQTPGSLVMRVTATKGNSHAALLVNQTLTADGATLVQVPTSQNTAPPPPPARTASPVVPQPGQTAQAQPLARTGASPALIPATPSPAAAASAQKLEPTVSVTGASPDTTQHSGRTKWFIIAAVVAGAAGAGVAVMGKGKSNSSTPAASGLTIGTPSVSVGAPTH
jgi:hypothetical protein